MSFDQVLHLTDDVYNLIKNLYKLNEFECALSFKSLLKFEIFHRSYDYF